MKVDLVKIAKSIEGVLNPWKGDLDSQKFGNLLYALVAVFMLLAPVLQQTFDLSPSDTREVNVDATSVDSESDLDVTPGVDTYLESIDATDGVNRQDLRIEEVIDPDSQSDASNLLDVLNADAVSGDAVVRTEFFDECYVEDCRHVRGQRQLRIARR